MNAKRVSRALVGAALAAAGVQAGAATASSQAGTQVTSSGAVFWSGDGSYLSQANIPVGFYAGGSPVFLETLEDGTLDGGLSATGGTVITVGAFTGTRDSVDADDGLIDGTCGPQVSMACASLFNVKGSSTFTFSGSSLPSAFGLVWTGGDFNVSVTVSATAADGSSLGSVLYSNIGNGGENTTVEDRFFGVQFAGGVKSITVTNSGGGIEVDHIQYGQMAAAVPEPATWALWFSGAGLLAWRRRRMAA